MSVRTIINTLHAIAFLLAVVVCFISFATGIMAVVVVILSDIFCYAICSNAGKRDLLSLGAMLVVSMLLFWLQPWCAR